MLSTHARAGLVGLLAGILVCLAAGPAAAQTTLRYKFKPGDKLRYTIEQKLRTHVNPLGKDVEQDMAEILDVTWQVGSVDAEGKAKITQTIDRVRFTLNGQGSKVDYDSKVGKMPDDQFAKQVGPPMAALAGAEITVTLDPQGVVSDFKAPHVFLKALKGFPGVGVEMGEFFSEDGLRRMTCQLFPVLPKEETDKGKTWNNRFELKSTMGTLKVNNKYTYEGPAASGDKKLEKIAVVPKFTLFIDLSDFPDPKPTNVGRVKKQEAKGSALIDNEAGRLVESSLLQELEVGSDRGAVTRKTKSTFTMKLAP
jgi:hypothetical protein